MMTDKQIKEGIDVSQCECYSVENNSCNDTLSGSCMKEKCQIFRLLQTIKAKEKEYEGLKKQLQGDKCLITSIGKMNYQLLQEYDKLKKCLAEIEVIAMGIMDDDLEESSAYYDAKQILQKISEVEND